MSQAPSKFPRVGETFQERYQLEEVIGQGGYARVYRARQTDLGRNVAIKVLRTRDMNRAKEAAQRFEREARLVSQLRDPHTITVYDYGRTESGALYMITELIDGRTLHEYVQSVGAVEPIVACNMILGVLFSLHEAHERGILHRDIKPANVMVFELPGRPDQVKLLDFGIAKAFDGGGGESDGDLATALTARGRVVGSPGYMSPEQIRGDQLSPASDIYSTGLVFYEMLTGNRAISSDDLRAAFEQIEGGPISLPGDLKMPAGLREIVEKMIEKSVDARYQTAQAVIDELTPLTRPPTGPVPAATRPDDAAGGAKKTDDAARRFMVLAIIAVLVAAIATIAFLTML